MTRDGNNGRKWTQPQWRGITTTGHSLLVSAAAGSGKTAVLAERCAHLVAGAPDPCDVDELLVVTFTEAAAAEMKGRIANAIRASAATQPSEHVARQLPLLERANVSTLHGFCSRMLRQHFHLVGLDPAFSVMDGDEARLLRAEIVKQLLADRYELDDGGEFQRFVDAYGDGSDERLGRLVVQTHEMLCSLVDGEGWIDRSLRRIQEAAEGRLAESELGRELTEFVSSRLAALSDRCGDAINQLGRLGGFTKYVELLRDHLQTLEHWQRRLAAAGMDALSAELAGLTLCRMPPVRNDVPNKDAAKSLVDSIRAEMKAGVLCDTLRFTTAEWQAGLKAVLPHARVFLDLVMQFGKRYRLAKDGSRAIDFSDLERFALEALRDPSTAPKLSPSAAARSYHRRFRHVLVDEYQDINEVQDAILSLLSHECVRGEPGVETNLFCVGDVKQSIYRFRLAEPTRFLERERAFRAATPPPPYSGERAGVRGAASRGEVIDLQANFRSRAPLLAAINAVFERLMTADAVDLTYDQTHRLHPGKTYPPPPDDATCLHGAPIELHLLPDKLDLAAPDAENDGNGQDADELDRAEREAVLVARRIREMLGLDGGPPTSVMEEGPDGVMRPRPMRFGDVVILLRSMKHKADEYAKVLESAGVPVHNESGTGFFESTEVREMLALLAVLDNPKQDIPLAAVLRSPLTGLPRPEDALATIRVAYPAESGVPFHEAVVRYAAEQEDELAEWLREFLLRVARWRELAQRRPLSDLLWKLYQDTGCLAYCGGLANGRQRVANLTYLHERATQFASFHRQGLSRFLRFLDSLREESDLGQPSVATEGEDVVRIMSVHRSKGLEFPVVFLPDLGKKINLTDCSGPILADRRAGLGMVVVDEHKKVRYPSLASTLVKQRLRQQALAEEMRVLYVAMTRAKEHLVMMGTCGRETPERWGARWTGHDGPLPPDVVLGAATLLDWVGPVAAATGGPARDEVFRVTAYAAADVAGWEHPSRARPAWTEEQDRLARLQPLDPPPPPNEAADEVVRRLTERYPHCAFASLPAAESMSGNDDESQGAAPLFAGTTLRKSTVLLDRFEPTADEVGTAMHLVLQHLDPRRPCDANDVAAQVRELVDRKLLRSQIAPQVDIEAVCWLMSTPVGRLLREHAGNVRRELHVYAAATPRPSDPMDCVMLRGRIDALIPLARESILIDYKTDFIAPADVAGRAAFYRPQIAAYAQAIRQITAKPVRAYLVFLRPRVLHEVAG